MRHADDLPLTVKGVEFAGRARTLMSGLPVCERAACTDRYGDWKMTPSAKNACAAIPGTTNAHWGRMITGAQMRAARALLQWSTAVLAGRCGVPQARIREAEAVNRVPNLEAGDCSN
jgi:hypothetical protein